MRRLLVLTLLLVASSFGARAAYACSCVGRPELREAIRRSEVAFSGEITQSLGGGVYAVRVDQVLKGDVGPAERLRAESERASSCGIRVTPGPVIYTGDRRLEIHQCSSHWLGDEVAPVLAAARLTPSPPAAAVPPMGPEPPPRAEPDRPGWLLLGFVVTAGAAAAGAAVLARHRSRNY